MKVISQLVALSLSISVPALAQTVDTGDLGKGYAHLVGFAAEPQIAAASFDINDPDDDTTETSLNAIKVPFYREFARDEDTWHWYAQGAASYMSYEQDLDLAADLPFLPVPSKSKWTAYSGALEGGIIIPLGAGFSLAPGAGLGVSRLENEMRISDPVLEDLLRPIADGSLYNWETSTTIGRANLGLLYERQFGTYLVKSKAHVIYSYIDSFNESRKFEGFASHSSTATLDLDVKHPLSYVIADQPLFIIGHFSAAAFLGKDRDQLGFNHLFEAGASLGYDRYALGLLAIFGEDVSGLTVTFNYDY